MDVICFDVYYAFFHLSWFDNYSFFSWYGIFLCSIFIENQLMYIDQSRFAVNWHGFPFCSFNMWMFPDCFDFKISEKLLLCCLYMNCILFGFYSSKIHKEYLQRVVKKWWIINCLWYANFRYVVYAHYKKT